MSLASCRAAIRKVLSKRIDDSHVIEVGGAFTMKDIEDWALKSPSYVVTCLGVPSIEMQGGMVVASAAWAVFCLVESKQQATRHKQALLNAESVLAIVGNNERWEGNANARAMQISLVNMYTSAMDRIGVALWAARWRQNVDLSAQAFSTFDDFDTFTGEIAIGPPDTPTIGLEVDDLQEGSTP